MEIFKHIIIAITLLIFINSGKSLDIDKLVQKANLYYQQPLQDGKSQEYTLNMIDEFPTKTNIKVIIHGYTGNRFHSSIRPVGNAYMAKGMDNVLLADWEDAATVDYLTSRKAVAKVGFYLGKVLEEFLNKHEIPTSEVHIIGHSLGAHIAGNMGRYFNGSVGRVTGLDPALPLFTSNVADGLHSSDGAFVDAVHTDFPVFGDITPRGTADFYPNYGYTPQKGCESVDLESASKLIFDAYSCSHNRAVNLYAESIVSPQNFPAIPCSLYAIKMQSSAMCEKRISELGLTKSTIAEAIAAKNEEIVVYMGEYVSKSANGVFYLETYDAPPYGIGVYSQIN